MKNLDIIKYFFSDEDKDIDSIAEYMHVGCPNSEFKDNHPCKEFDEEFIPCLACWKKFLEEDSGLELTISIPKDNEPHEER